MIFGAILTVIVVVAVLWLVACFLTNGRPYLPERRK